MQQTTYKPQWYHFIVDDQLREKVGRRIAATVKFELGEKFPPLIPSDAEQVLPEAGSVFTLNIKTDMVATLKIINIQEKLVTIEVLNIELLYFEDPKMWAPIRVMEFPSIKQTPDQQAQPNPTPGIKVPNIPKF